MRELAVLLAVAGATIAYLRADLALLVAALILGVSAGFALRAGQ